MKIFLPFILLTGRLAIFRVHSASIDPVSPVTILSNPMSIQPADPVLVTQMSEPAGPAPVPLLNQTPMNPVTPTPNSFQQSPDCPKLPKGSLGICIDNCMSDLDCIGGANCCSNGCGLRCVQRQIMKGQCPPPQDIPIAVCSNCPLCSCSMDSHCKLGQKCCQSSCGQPICI